MLRGAITNYVPTSEGPSAKLWPLLTLPLLFLQLSALAEGGKGQLSLMCEARNGQTGHWPRHNCAHAHRHTQTQC